MAATTQTSGGKSQLNRNLERIFEEAQCSGELKLSGRRLREFPSLSANYSLFDTVFADLSKNKLTELPAEVTQFGSLEKLVIYHNVLRTIPDSISFLQSLTYIDLSRNQLSVLPPALCLLPLQVLLVSHNRLVSIPEEIGKLSSLIELDVSCNQLSHLPPQLGDLQHLKSLKLRKNLLVELPREIVFLKLHLLDLGENRISSLPVELRFMSTLEDLCVEHNPLVIPPSHLCTRGRIHIFKFLEIQAIREDKKKTVIDGECRRIPRKPSALSDNRVSGTSQSLDPRRKRGTIDSGYNTCDGGDKRWSQDSHETHGDADESRRIALRAAELIRRPSLNGYPSPGVALPSTPAVNGTSPYHVNNNFTETPKTFEKSPSLDLPQNKPEDSSEDEEELEERRRAARKILEQQAGLLESKASFSNTGAEERFSNATKSSSEERQHIQTYREYKESLRIQRSQDVYKSRQNSNSHTPSPDAPPVQFGEMPQQVVRTFNEAPPVPNKIHNSPRHATPPAKPSPPPPAPGPASHSSSGYVVRAHAPPFQHNAATPPPIPQPAAAPTLPGRSPLTPQQSPPKAQLGFTARRDIDKKQQEADQIEALRNNIESRLKVTLPDDLNAALADGVVLCHLANHIRPRAVASIHVPSPAVPKLPVAKCRRNIENFIEACRKIGVSEERLCLASDLLDRRGLIRVAVTVNALLVFQRGRTPVSHALK